MSRLPAPLNQLPLPIIGAPLFIISNPKLVIAQCRAGVTGAMPALNARPAAQLDDWLAEITETLAVHNRAHPEQPAAPFAINQIVHKSNDRLERDLQVCEKYKVPLVITSLGDPSQMNFGGDTAAKAWKDIWGCGQGIGAVSRVQSTADFVAQLRREYEEARQRLLA